MGRSFCFGNILKRQVRHTAADMDSGNTGDWREHVACGWRDTRLEPPKFVVDGGKPGVCHRPPTTPTTWWKAGRLPPDERHRDGVLRKVVDGGEGWSCLQCSTNEAIDRNICSILFRLSGLEPQHPAPFQGWVSCRSLVLRRSIALPPHPNPPSASRAPLTRWERQVIRESGCWRGGAGARNGDIVSTNRGSRTGAAGGHTARTPSPPLRKSECTLVEGRLLTLPPLPVLHSAPYLRRTGDSTCSPSPPRRPR